MGKHVFNLVLFFMVSTLSACTGYQDINSFWSYTGGYWEFEVNEKLHKIGFDGNSFISLKTTENYLMYRCAELARDRKKPYFFIYHTLPDAIADKRATWPVAGNVGGKARAFVYVVFLGQPYTGAISTAGTLRQLKPIVDKQTMAAETKW